MLEVGEDIIKALCVGIPSFYHYSKWYILDDTEVRDCVLLNTDITDKRCIK